MWLSKTTKKHSLIYVVLFQLVLKSKTWKNKQWRQGGIKVWNLCESDGWHERKNSETCVRARDGEKEEWTKNLQCVN
jgi:hypothetical protein